MLTRKQRDLLLLIHERMASGEVAPSFEEMKEALGLRSKSGIHRLISALVERGYLERLPHRARALQVKRLPEGYQPSEKDQTQAAALIRNTQPLQNDTAEQPSSSVSVPLYGKIAAGSPIEALRDEGQTIDIPPFLIGNGDHYALRVEGDSMIKAGINDKDIVLVKRAETANNGVIVVALVDDTDVTLKRFRKAGNKIILEPENDDYEPWVLEPARVKIQGHLVSLMRNYH